MFTFMREQMQKEAETNMIATSVLEGVSDNVKDRFLTDPDLVSLGAERDPEIERLVAQIPEYLPNPEKSISKITESLLAEI